jgi:Tfp pilus assembly protein PilF
MATETKNRPIESAVAGAEKPRFDKRTRLHKGRRVNVPLLIATAAVAAVLATAGYFWHRRQEAQLYGAIKQRALASAASEDWARAVGYWQQYLSIAPDDFESRMNLIDAVQKRIVAPRDRRRLSLLLHEAIGKAQDEGVKADLRVRAAENSLEMGDYAGAYAAAQDILSGDEEQRIAPVAMDTDNGKKLIRVCALAGRVLMNEDRTDAAAGAESDEARKRAEVSMPMEANYLATASKAFPGDIRLAVVAANLYRSHASAIDVRSPLEQADEFMNRVVAERPDDADVYVERYRYRKGYGLADADADLAKALEIEPDHFEGLILSAGAVAQKDKDFDGARKLLKQAIAASPKDNRGYLALAEIEGAQQNWDAVAAALQEGQRAVGPQDLAIGRSLTYALIKTNRLTGANGAKESLQRLDEAFQSQLSEINGAYRRSIQDQLQMLRAQLAIASGDLRGAVTPLKAVIASSDEASGAQVNGAALEAKQALAALMEQMGSWDVAASYWLDLATVPPEAGDEKSRGIVEARRRAAGEASRRAGIALLAAGQVDRAIKATSAYMNPPLNASGAPAWSPNPDAHLVLLRAHLQKQLSIPAAQRNWAEFLSALQAGKELHPPRSEVYLAEFDYLRSLGDEKSIETAVSVLSAGEQAFPENATFWKAAAIGYQSLGRKADASRSLAQFNALEKDFVQRAALNVVFALQSGDADAAESLLVQMLKDAKGNDRIGLQMLWIDLLLGSGATERALQVAADCIKEAEVSAKPVGEESSAPMTRLLAAGIEAALRKQDFQLAEQWEAKLAAADQSDDFKVKYFRARRLLEQYDKLDPQDRTLAEKAVGEVQAARPNWGEAAKLAGQLAELKNNLPQAIENYQLALTLGHKNPAIVERLVAVLYAQGRYDEADALMAKASSVSSSSLQMETLAIASALRRNQMSEAIALARKAVATHPDDPVRQIWLANLLGQDAIARHALPSEAVESLRTSIRQFPTDARVWSALFTLFLRTQQNEEAKQLLAEFAEAVDDASWDRHYVSAKVHQQLGERLQAIKEAEAAAKIQPDNVPGRLLLADVLMSADVARSIAEFETIRKSLKPSPAEDGLARRQLAVLYSTLGTDEDLQRADELLKHNSEDGASADETADVRLHATLLARRGKDRTQRRQNTTEARKLLESFVNERGTAVDDVDRLLLAKIYEQEAMQAAEQSGQSVAAHEESDRARQSLLHAAKENYQKLTSRAGAPVDYSIAYTDFLLRQLNRTTGGNGPGVMSDVFIDEAKRRVGELEREAQQSSDAVKELKLLSGLARLQNALNDKDAATAAVAQFVEKKLPELESALGQPRAWVAIASLYSSLGDHADAESWYRKLVPLAPDSYVLVVRELMAQGRLDDALNECLTERDAADGDSARRATVLAQLLASAPVDAERSQRAEPVIAAALKKHSDDVELLMATAVLNVTRKKDAEAVRNFRRVVELAPDNALALNNLATLLAEQPDQLDEAQALIGRAIKANGREPALLDTLGTIQVRRGESQDAIDSLEEAVARGGGDPRYYFHLAAAYHAAKNADRAKEAFEVARNLGLAKSILTLGDQQLLEGLVKQFGPLEAPPKLETNNGSRAPGAWKRGAMEKSAIAS